MRSLFTLLGLVLAVTVLARPSVRFAESQIIGNSHGNDLVLADFKGDGRIDAFIANGAGDSSLPSKLWLNDGAGHFRDSEQDFGRAKSWSAACAPVRPGGALDVFVANGDWHAGDASHLWINDGLGRFACSRDDFGRANSSGAALGDLNGDGAVDLFLANHPYDDGRGGECEVWLNDRRGKFVDSGQRLEKSRAPRRVKLADLNGDGTLDALVLFADGANVILLNDGRGRFTNSQIDIGRGDNIDLAIGDVDGDGRLDLVIAKGAWGSSPKGIEIWHNDGTGRYVMQARLGDHPVYGVALADLDGDKSLDIVAVCGPGESNQVFVNDGKGSFVDAAVDIGNGGNKVGIADLNHDGLADLFIVGDDCASVWLQVIPAPVSQKNRS